MTLGVQEADHSSSLSLVGSADTMKRLLFLLAICGATAPARAPWPTAGGNSARQHTSVNVPGSNLQVISAAAWDPCEPPAPAAQVGLQTSCEWNPDLLSDGDVLLHWSSIQGLAARSVENASLVLWNLDLGPVRGCAVFDVTRPGFLATQTLTPAGALTVSTLKLNAGGSSPSVTHEWTVALGTFPK